jgi:hypothetical protein
MRRIFIYWLAICGVLFRAWQAFAQLGQIPTHIQPPSSTPFSITYVANAGTNSQNPGSNTNTFTFSRLNIGTAGSTRIVAVRIAYHAGTAGTAITAVTIGGNSANQATSAAAQTNQGEGTDVWYLAVSSGTTANILVTLNSTGAIRMAVFVYAVNGTAPASRRGTGRFSWRATPQCPKA